MYNYLFNWSVFFYAMLYDLLTCVNHYLDTKTQYTTIASQKIVVANLFRKMFNATESDEVSYKNFSSPGISKVNGNFVVAMNKTHLNDHMNRTGICFP